jgi:hypothetical protein
LLYKGAWAVYGFKRLSSSNCLGYMVEFLLITESNRRATVLIHPTAIGDQSAIRIDNYSLINFRMEILNPLK